MEIRKDDVGIEIILTIYDDIGICDISDASVHNFKFLPPGDNVPRPAFVRPASFVTDGQDGKLIYTTVAGDLPYVGMWQVQAWITQPTKDRKSTIYLFEVCKNL